MLGDALVLGAALGSSSTNVLFCESPTLTSIAISFGLPPSLSVTSTKPPGVISLRVYLPGSTQLNVYLPAVSVVALATTVPLTVSYS